MNHIGLAPLKDFIRESKSACQNSQRKVLIEKPQRKIRWGGVQFKMPLTWAIRDTCYFNQHRLWCYQIKKVNYGYLLPISGDAWSRSGQTRQPNWTFATVLSKCSLEFPNHLRIPDTYESKIVARRTSMFLVESEGLTVIWTCWIYNLCGSHA